MIALTDTPALNIDQRSWMLDTPQSSVKTFLAEEEG